MKKLKFDLKNFDAKQFAIQHIEKVALVLFLIVGAWIAYGAMDIEVFSKTPEQLRDTATRANTQVANSTFTSYLESLKNEVPAGPMSPEEKINWQHEEYGKTAKDSRQSVSENVFALVGWYDDINKPAIKRSEPRLFPLEDLVAAYGMGAFGIKKTRGGSPRGGGDQPRDVPRGQINPNPQRGRAPALDPEDPLAADQLGLEQLGDQIGVDGLGEVTSDMEVVGKRWVVLTGMVPISQQQREYYEKLNVNTANIRPQDLVKYLGFEVWRGLDVPGDPEGKNIQWQKVELPLAFMATWSLRKPEVVPAGLTHPELTSPLPPLLDRAWSEDVIHPRIEQMLLDQRQQFAQAKRRLDEERKAKKEGRKGEARGFGGFGARRDDPAAIQDPLLEEDPLAQPFPDEFDPALGEGPAGGAAATTQRFAYSLFRFFDFDVEPGYTYRYRVRLVLSNPNHGIKPESLDDPKSGEKEQLMTDWSPISKPVQIQRDSHLLASSVSEGSVTKDDIAKVMVRQWDKRLGVNASKEFEMLRGQIANFRDETVPVRGPRGNWRDEQVTFVTNQQLIDFTGGSKLRYRSREVAPSEMLFIDAKGNLSVHGELEDWRTVRQEQMAKKEAVEVKPETDPTGFPTLDPENPLENYPGPSESPRPRNRNRNR